MKKYAVPLFLLCLLSAACSAQSSSPCHKEEPTESNELLFQYRVEGGDFEYFLTLIPYSHYRGYSRLFGAETLYQIERRDEGWHDHPAGYALKVAVEDQVMMLEDLDLRFDLAKSSCLPDDTACKNSFDDERGITEFKAEGKVFKLVSCFGVFSPPFIEEMTAAI